MAGADEGILYSPYTILTAGITDGSVHTVYTTNPSYSLQVQPMAVYIQYIPLILHTHCRYNRWQERMKEYHMHKDRYEMMRIQHVIIKYSARLLYSI
jgi:hypothetical protein